MAYSSITKPEDYIKTVLYTGNGTARDITTGLTSTDWVWIKRRDNTGNHRIFDIVRGVHKNLQSNTTNAEQTNDQTLTAFGTNTFSLGTDSGSYDVNTNSQTYASWNWAAGGSASSNTDGTITSSVSANTTSGFSIVQYTGNATAGATVGHGLNSAPEMIIVKKKNATKDWNVYHVSMGNTKGMYLNLTNVEQTHTNWNNTTPTSSVFSIGSDDQVNGSGQTYIAYCFHSVKGYLKLGDWTGNGNTDGPFNYTGFKPAWIILKNRNGANNWRVYDNLRQGFNVNNNSLIPNNNAADATSTHLDILSNGFKLRTSGAGENGSGSSFIYMAVAEHPLVANVNGGIPATAR
jgi:hypothetical protein